MPGPDRSDGEETFEVERPRLVGLAYRILGSRAEAEDVVQDAWLRWQGAGSDTIERPAAWLTTVTSRLALDRLRSARHQREAYVGPWLPEPVVLAPDPTGDPAEAAELRDSLTIGFLVLLERLGPVERVVFLLADVFGVPYAEIAATVDRTPEACRQIASRARQRVRAERPRFAATAEDAWEAATAFLAAAQAGDLDGLLAVLADDAVLVSDGGPDRHAARRPVVGADRVARFVANLAKRTLDGSHIEPATINGEPGVVLSTDGKVWLVLAIHVERSRVTGIHAMLNPDKVTSAATPTGLT